MSSIEVAKQRKEIEANFKEKANLLTGQLSSVKGDYEAEMKELQKQCSHMWDTGESGIQQLDGLSICTICRKKFKI